MRIEPGLGDGALDQLNHPALAELHRRQIDRETQAGHPRRCCHTVLTTGAVQHPLGERADQADVLGQPDELGRAHHAAARMAPAQQRLDGDDAPGLQIALWLIMHGKLIGREALAQLAAPAGRCGRATRFICGAKKQLPLRPFALGGTWPSSAFLSNRSAF